MEKKTLKEQFVEVKAIVEKEGRTDLVEFIDSRIAQLEKKGENRKPTKVQLENEGFKATVMEIMTSDKVTATEVMNKAGLPSNQKATAILKMLVADGKVVRLEEGKKVFYTLA